MQLTHESFKNLKFILHLVKRHRLNVTDFTKWNKYYNIPLNLVTKCIFRWFFIRWVISIIKRQIQTKFPITNGKTTLKFIELNKITAHHSKSKIVWTFRFLPFPIHANQNSTSLHYQRSYTVPLNQFARESSNSELRVQKNGSVKSPVYRRWRNESCVLARALISLIN